MIFLALLQHALIAAEERSERAIKRVYFSSQRQFWDIAQEEDGEKRRKKYRLGSGAKKETGFNPTRLPMQTKTTTIDDILRLGGTPIHIRQNQKATIPLSMRQSGQHIIAQIRYCHHIYQGHPYLDPIIAHMKTLFSSLS